MCQVQSSDCIHEDTTAFARPSPSSRRCEIFCPSELARLCICNVERTVRWTKLVVPQRLTKIDQSYWNWTNHEQTVFSLRNHENYSQSFLGGFFSAIFLDRRNASCFFFWKGWNFNESSTSEVWDWSIITSRGDEQSFGRQTLPETNSSHLKIHPWKFGDSYWKPSFLGSMWVSGRVFTRHLRWVLIWCDTLPETKT